MNDFQPISYFQILSEAFGEVEATINEVAAKLSLGQLSSMRLLGGRKNFRSGEGQVIKPVASFKKERKDSEALQSFGLVTMEEIDATSWIMKPTAFGLSFYNISRMELEELEIEATMKQYNL